MDTRWYIIEALKNGKTTNCGKVRATEDEIRAAFPHAAISPLAADTSLVTVTKRP